MSTKKKAKGKTTRKWRREVVRDYQARKVSEKEYESAEQPAARFGVSVSSVRRWDKMYRNNGKRGLLPKVSYKVGRRRKYRLISYL